MECMGNKVLRPRVGGYIINWCVALGMYKCKTSTHIPHNFVVGCKIHSSTLHIVLPLSRENVHSNYLLNFGHVPISYLISLLNPCAYGSWAINFESLDVLFYLNCKIKSSKMIEFVFGTCSELGHISYVGFSSMHGVLLKTFFSLSFHITLSLSIMGRICFSTPPISKCG